MWVAIICDVVLLNTHYYEDRLKAVIADYPGECCPNPHFEVVGPFGSLDDAKVAIRQAGLKVDMRECVDGQLTLDEMSDESLHNSMYVLKKPASTGASLGREMWGYFVAYREVRKRPSSFWSELVRPADR